jgi:Flp pilus assembly secretin CpaC
MSRPQLLLRTALLTFAFLAAEAGLGATHDRAHAEDAGGATIEVVLNQAKVMHISRPADVVIIGNPAIADATIQDNQTLIITGHSFGTTNLIVLDSTGQPIATGMLTVKPPNDQVVTVYRRAARQTFSCTPDCAPVVAVGDTQDAFSGVAGQIQVQNSISSAAAGGTK